MTEPVRAADEQIAKTGTEAWRPVLLIAIFWLVWGALHTVSLNAIKQGFSSATILWFAFSDAAIWAILTPIGLWMGRRLPVQSQQVVSRLFVHFCVGVCVVALHEFLDALQNYLIHVVWFPSRAGMTIGEFFRYVVPHRWHSNIILYSAIVGLGQFLVHQRHLAETRHQMTMLRAHLAEARVNALRLQLQPHFLFNCLNTIAGLVNQEPHRARKMIGALAELLRLTLETEDPAVSLRDELHFVRTYLKIEGIRFGDRLQVTEAVATDHLDESVPAFILQPLVENAVRHGLANHSRQGCITISSVVKGDRLELEVKDNGVGMSLDKLKRGTGLSSVQSRLQQLYGAEHGWNVHSSPGEGTRIVISLPRRRNPTRVD